MLKFLFLNVELKYVHNGKYLVATQKFHIFETSSSFTTCLRRRKKTQQDTLLKWNYYVWKEIALHYGDDARHFEPDLHADPCKSVSKCRLYGSAIICFRRCNFKDFARKPIQIFVIYSSLFTENICTFLLGLRAPHSRLLGNSFCDVYRFNSVWRTYGKGLEL